MAISGTVVLEDTVISFAVIDNNKMNVTISDSYKGMSEQYQCDAEKFMAALAIAIHWEGTPDYQKDYPAAESVQPKNPLLRFIP